jgi:hypothetical protein
MQLNKKLDIKSYDYTGMDLLLIHIVIVRRKLADITVLL